LDPALHWEEHVTENLSLIARLSSDTQLEHRAADGELERLVAEPSAHAYRAWLARQLGFHTPLEAALEATPKLVGIIGIRPRSKIARLRQDLATLGVEHATTIQPCPAVPASFASVPSALGWMYVAERWTLHFHNAYRQLARALPGEMAFASSYLKCYEGNAPVMWRAFVIAVDASCRGDKNTAELVTGAHDAFRAIRDYSPIVPASVATAFSGPGARATRG
jgi:heme oxygenase